MTSYIDRIEEIKSKEKLKKEFAFVANYHELQLELDRKSPVKSTHSNIDKLVNDVSSVLLPYQVNNLPQTPMPSAKEIASGLTLAWEKTVHPLNPTAKEINSIAAGLVFAMEKTVKLPIAPLAAQIEQKEAETKVPPTENLEEEAPVENANPETVQRQTLWDMWQKAADDLGIDLQNLMADPFESHAANKVMLLCSHLASQMNHESARALLDFIEDTRIENLKKAYQPGALTIIPVIVQLLGALLGGFCGFMPVAKGLAGHSAKGWESASAICNNFLSQGGGSVSSITNNVNQGKQSIVGHELETDKRLQQDLQQRRQQAEQAAKRELENIVRMAQQKHETVRSINSN